MNLGDDQMLGTGLSRIKISFELNDLGENRTLLNGKDVEGEIRSPEITARVSEVSAKPVVRELLISRQREIGLDKGIVMDGRDIGTHVFPNAELKIFLVSDPEIRARRRAKEMEEKGIEVEESEILRSLRERDKADSERKMNPLRKADDAIVLDNSNMSIQEQVIFVVEKAREIIG